MGHRGPFTLKKGFQKGDANDISLLKTLFNKSGASTIYPAYPEAESKCETSWSSPLAKI